MPTTFATEWDRAPLSDFRLIPKRRRTRAIVAYVRLTRDEISVEECATALFLSDVRVDMNIARRDLNSTRPFSAAVRNLHEMLADG